jgi:hypothetical protein
MPETFVYKRFQAFLFCRLFLCKHTIKHIFVLDIHVRQLFKEVLEICVWVIERSLIIG